MEAIKLRILKVKELVVKGDKAKLKISAEEDIWADSTTGQVV